MNRLLLPAVLLLTASIYGGALSNGFVWDDFLLFIDDASLRSGPINWDSLSRPVLNGTTYLRPLVLLSFAVEYRLWGVNAFASHAVNLSLHLLNVSLVFILARKVFDCISLPRHELRAALAAGVFALHPSMLEAVVWISGRFDLMVTTLVLAALVADAFIEGRNKRAFVVSTCFGLALCAKEVAIALPVLLLCVRILMTSPNGASLWKSVIDILRADWPTVMALGLTFFGYVFLRLSAFESLIHVEPYLARKVSDAAMHSLLVLNTLFFYIREIGVPFSNFGPFHPLDIDVLGRPLGFFRAVLSVTVLALIVALVMCRVAAGFLLIGALFCLVPVLHIVPLTIGGNIGHDRFLTLPLAFVALALMTMRLNTGPQVSTGFKIFAATLLFGAWGLISAASIYITVPLWRNQITLWTWIYARYPNFEPAQTQFLGAALRYRRFDLAGPVFERLRAEGPLEARQQLLYGGYLTARGDIDEAEKYIMGVLSALHSRRNAANANPMDYAYAYSTLARIEMTRKDFGKAMNYVEKSLASAPNAPYLLLQKSFVLLGAGQVEGGERLFSQSISMAVPEHRLLAIKEREAFLQNLCVKPLMLEHAACALRQR